MTNYTCLQQNILGSIQHEEAKKMFLRAEGCKQNDRYSYWAEEVARGADYLCENLKHIIGMATKPFEANNEVKSDLLDFVLTRYWNAVKDSKYSELHGYQTIDVNEYTKWIGGAND